MINMKSIYIYIYVSEPSNASHTYYSVVYTQNTAQEYNIVYNS